MAKYLRYTIRNIEPLRIADDSTSQRGQTSTLHYIPGSTIRGLVINALAADSKFPLMKKALFSSGIRFLNAYPLAAFEEGGKMEIKELIPSPKGLYEHKGERDKEGTKAVENSIANEDFSEYGLKGADIGKYCYIEDGCVCYFPIKTGSDMKINMDREGDRKQDVFRSEYIMPGYSFAGYIAMDEETEGDDVSGSRDGMDAHGNAVTMGEIADKIRGVFSGQVILGNGRSAGMGKCIAEERGYCRKAPYSEYQEECLLSGKCYMMLLSNAVMRGENGEYCGLDMDALAKLLGVERLEIEQCATSAVDVKGFNRTWKCKIPSVTMFEQGSVFRLSFEGELTAENAGKLMDRGIGIRRNEGFGRIIFLKDYGRIHKKQEKSMVFKYADTENHLNDEDRKVLGIAAGCHYRNLIEQAVCRYIVKNPLTAGGMADSQLGQVEALAVSYRYKPDKAFEEIENFFSNMEGKEAKNNIQKERYSMDVFARCVRGILSTELEITLGIETKKRDRIMGLKKAELLSREEENTWKLHLLSSWIRYYNKQEKEGE